MDLIPSVPTWLLDVPTWLCAACRDMADHVQEQENAFASTVQDKDKEIAHLRHAMQALQDNVRSLLDTENALKKRNEELRAALRVYQEDMMGIQAIASKARALPRGLDV